MDIAALNSLTEGQKQQLAKVINAGQANSLSSLSPTTSPEVNTNTAYFGSSPSNVTRSLLRSPSSSSLNSASIPIGIPSPSNANLRGPRYPSNSLGTSPGHSPHLSIENLVNIGSPNYQNGGDILSSSPRNSAASPAAHHSRPTSAHHSRSNSINASLPTAAQLQQQQFDLSDPLSNPFTTALITQLTNKEAARQRQLRQQLHSRSPSGGDELEFLNGSNSLSYPSAYAQNELNLGFGNSNNRRQGSLNFYDPSAEDSYTSINPTTSAASASTPQQIFSAINQQNSELDAILSSSPISSAISNPSSHPGTPFLTSTHNSPLLSFSGTDGIPELDIAMDFESHMSLTSSGNLPVFPSHPSNQTSPPLTLSIPNSSSPEIQLTSPSPLTAKPKEEEIEGFPPGMRGDPIKGERRPKGKGTLEMERMLAGLVPDPQAFEGEASSPAGPNTFFPTSQGGPSEQDVRNSLAANFLNDNTKRQRSKSETALPMPRPDLWYNNPDMGIPIAPNNAALLAAGYGFDPATGLFGGGLVNPMMPAINPRDILAYAGLDGTANGNLFGQMDALAARNQFLNVGGLDSALTDHSEGELESSVPSSLHRRKSNPTASRRASPYDTFLPTAEADEFAPSGGSTSIRRSRSTGHADAARRHARTRSDLGLGGLGYGLMGQPTTAGGFLAPPGMRRTIELGMNPGFTGVPNGFNGLGGDMAAFGAGFPAQFQGQFPLFGVGPVMDGSFNNTSPHSSPTSIGSSGHSPPFGVGRPGTSSSRGSSPGSANSALIRTGDGFVDPISKTTAATKKAAMDRRKPGTTARFKCEYCGETFTRHYNLKGHIRAHKNERPFVCEFPGCEKAFARAHDRKRHQLLHTGEKKYKCDVCQTAFVRLDALQRHHKSENGQQCVQILQSRGWSMNPDGTLSNSVVEIASVPQIPSLPLQLPLQQQSQSAPSGSRGVLV